MTEPHNRRDPIEELASEFIERIRGGGSPIFDDYLEQYPELAEEMRDLFPTIASIERLKAHKEQSSSGRASLGAVKLERLGDFRIVREIGRGGMGIVFEAEQESLKRRVAIKVLPRHALVADEQRERFQREARIAAGLNHTNIVPVFGVGEHDGFRYLVMRYIEGIALDRVIARLVQGVPSQPIQPSCGEELFERVFGSQAENEYWRVVARIGHQAACALHHAHSRGTLHRDIKPGNLLVDTGGSLWITDFGVAKALEADDATCTGDITGTLRYMAPERFKGHTDARSDIYSLGLTLFELLTRRPAFHDTDQSALIRTITLETIPRPRRIDPEIPRDFETIVLKATARDPDRRYPTAEELAADLNRFLENRPIEARRTTPFERSWLWCRRNPVPAGLAAAVLFLLVIVAVTASVGYVQTRNANLQVSRALGGERSQREKAEAVSKLAREVLDGIYSRFTAGHIAGQPDVTLENSQGDTITIPVQAVLSRETAVLLQDLLVFYDRLAAQDADNRELQCETARAYQRVGMIHHYLSHVEEAEIAFRKAIAIYGELSAFEEGSFSLERSKIHNALGNVMRSSGRIRESIDEHLTALDILQTGSTETGLPEARYELARTYYCLGMRRRRDPGPNPHDMKFGSARRLPPGGRRNRPPPDLERSIPPRDSDRRAPRPPPPFSAGVATTFGNPLEDLEKAVAILEELREEQPSSPDHAHLMACCYRERFQFTSRQEALKSQERAIAILNELAREHAGVPDYRYDLCETYAVWDVRSLNPDQLPAAEDDLRRALEIIDGLMAEYPNVPSYTASCVHLHHKLADILQRTDRPGLAEKNLERAITLQSSLVDLSPDLIDHKLWLAETQKSLARLLSDENRLQEARVLIEAAIAFLEPCLPEDPPPGRLRRALVDAYHNLAEILKRSEADREARDAIEQAEILRRTEPHRPGRAKSIRSGSSPSK